MWSMRSYAKTANICTPKDPSDGAYTNCGFTLAWLALVLSFWPGSALSSVGLLGCLFAELAFCQVGFGLGFGPGWLGLDLLLLSWLFAGSALGWVGFWMSGLFAGFAWHGLGQLWAGLAFVELAFCQVGFGFAIGLGWICFLPSWLFAGMAFC